MDYRRIPLATLISAGVLLAVGCSSPGPAEIHYGADLCDYCDMTIADQAFGAELVTTKGKVLKFDSIECLAASSVEERIAGVDVHSLWVTDFHQPGSFLTVGEAVIVATDRQKSPMGIGLVAVGSQAAAVDLIAQKGGRIVDWDNTKRLVAQSWEIEVSR